MPLTDIVSAQIEKHKYISTKQPGLERSCRCDIFAALLAGASRAYAEGAAEEQKETLQKAIESVRGYGYTDCGLNAEEMYETKLLLTDMKMYGVAMKMKQRSKERETAQSAKKAGRTKAVFRSRHRVTPAEDYLEYPHWSTLDP
jgi:hypothetical protein